MRSGLTGNRLAPWVALGLMLSVSHGVRADTLEGIFKAANQAYFEGDLAGAIRGFDELLAAGVEDADVYFNLATARARSGQLGHAILNYERALRADPSDEEAEAGLEAARRLLGHRRAEREGEATVRTRPPLSDALVRPFAENTLAVSTLALMALCFGLLIWRRRTTAESLRLGSGIAAAVVAVLLVLSGTALGVKARLLSEGEPAVVLNDSAELREGPDDRAQSRAKIPEGTAARVTAREGSFVKVRVSSGTQGWMSARDVAVIAAD